MAGDVFKVMLSSTYRDLIDHRQAVTDAIIGQGMLPLIMETDSANPSRGIITSSLAMVDEADAYVVLISNYRYGQVIEDPVLNADRLSVTELEFRRAEERPLPLCIFLMDEDVPVSPREARKEAPWADKLESFRQRAQHPSRIIATFASAEELHRKVTQTLARLKRELERPLTGEPATIAPPAVQPSPLPSPPEFYPKPPYTPGHAFEGRAQELATLDAWARSAEPVMVVEAIGGMGKSMLTWHWVNRRAPGLGVDWAGRLWYSFYERGADMRDFKVTALAYMTGQAPETIVKRPEADVTTELLARLREKPWLLVLDGLERVLAAYHRSDAAQAPDDDIEGDTGLKDRKPTDCIRPADDDLLRWLPACGPSKLLITSRLMPHVLTRFGTDVPNVVHVLLRGLAPEDAEAMLRRSGVRGEGARMRHYLTEAFGCHPLLVGFVAGLIRHASWAGMDFERWEDDARGGAAVNLTDPSITNRRNNILKLAFDALEPKARELLARMGMISNAVELEVLEALNPARPDPPDEVREPMWPDSDWHMLMLEDDLRDAKTKKKRLQIERWMFEREQELNREYISAKKDRAAYEAALSAWRQSPAFLTAPNWLNDTLVNLEIRGLLQWDRTTGMFDLHPVVRGYAICRLDAEERIATGQRVANHFASRAEPNYDEVTSTAEIADRIQVANALNLAGKLRDAWDVINAGTRFVLHRLERHYDILALLRPLFPNGWASPPLGVVTAGPVASEAAIALGSIGRHKEENAQFVFAIRDEMARGVSTHLAIDIRNHSTNFVKRNALAQRNLALAMSRAVGTAIRDEEQVLRRDLEAVSDCVEGGNLAGAKRIWSDMITRNIWQVRDGAKQPRTLSVNAVRLFREGALAETELRSAIEWLRVLGSRNDERRLWYILGIVRQASAQHSSAIAALEHAIQMARDVGLSDPEAEARRGLSLARLGRRADAEAAALSAKRDPPHVALADLWLALDQHDKAHDHALRGYEWAWADGPPYCHHWELERCRAVLRALGEPEPVLPPFDPAKIEPLPYEADINRLLAEHANKNPPQN